jgi:hypothetical protein
MTGTQFYRSGSMATGLRSPVSLGQEVSRLTALSQNFWLSVFDLSTTLIDDALQVVGDLQPVSGRRPRRACEVPQYPCPNPRLGTVVREAYVGERVRVPLRVKNKTPKARTYQFTTEPLRNVRGEAASALDLSPAQHTLGPGEVRVLEASLPVSAEVFEPGLDYTGDIVITSEKCDPQLLRFTLRVKSEDAAPLIKLGCPCDPPVRRVNWYDHFYCDTTGCDTPGETDNDREDQLQRGK